MVNIIRKALESQYTDICTIYELGSVTDAESGITKKSEWIPVHENKPCKLSCKDVAPAEQSETYAEVKQAVKLFLAPEIVVEKGSRIEVTHEGIVKVYERSGEPVIYSNHQELGLKLPTNKGKA